MGRLNTETGFFKWTKGTPFNYATSIASSWIWAPAIFISAQQAYTNGLPGFLMFFLPNLFTLIFFAYVASYVRNRYEGYTVMDALNNTNKQQKAIHLLAYTLIVLCSCCTQIIGMQILLLPFVNSKALIAVAISLVCLALVWKDGLKSSIITDTYKYIVMFICAVVLLLNTKGEVGFVGTTTMTVGEIFTSFGMIAGLGLLSGVYSDMTLWQRAFSIPKENVKNYFIQSGMYFAVIPLIFGIIGFTCANSGLNWTLSDQFNSGILSIVLIVCVTATLMATLDSNLCAAAAIPCKVFGKSLVAGRVAMTLVLVVACILTSIEAISLTYMFLVYNTVRVCIAIPTLLIIFNKFDMKRLFMATLAGVLIAPIGYAITTNYLFTLFGFLVPLFGIKINKLQKENDV